MRYFRKSRLDLEVEIIWLACLLNHAERSDEIPDKYIGGLRRRCHERMLALSRMWPVGEFRYDGPMVKA